VPDVEPDLLHARGVERGGGDREHLGVGSL